MRTWLAAIGPDGKSIGNPIPVDQGHAEQQARGLLDQIQMCVRVEEWNRDDGRVLNEWTRSERTTFHQEAVMSETEQTQTDQTEDTKPTEPTTDEAKAPEAEQPAEPAGE